MKRHVARGLVLAGATIVGLWLVADVLLQIGGTPGWGLRSYQLVGWVAIGAGLALLLSALRQTATAVVVVLVVTAVAIAARSVDLGPLTNVATASFTWVTVGALAARALALAAR